MESIRPIAGASSIGDGGRPFINLIFACRHIVGKHDIVEQRSRRTSPIAWPGFPRVGVFLALYLVGFGRRPSPNIRYRARYRRIRRVCTFPPNNVDDNGVTYIDLIAHRHHMRWCMLVDDTRPEDLIDCESSLSSAGHYPFLSWSECAQSPTEEDSIAPDH